MPQAKNHMPVFIMGGLLIIYGLIVKTGALLPAMKYLSVHKSMTGVLSAGMGVCGVSATVPTCPNSPGKEMSGNFSTMSAGWRFFQTEIPLT